MLTVSHLYWSYPAKEISLFSDLIITETSFVKSKSRRPTSCGERSAPQKAFMLQKHFKWFRNDFSYCVIFQSKSDSTCKLELIMLDCIVILIKE